MGRMSSTWTETIAADETARFDRLAGQLRALQRGRAGAGGARRALHAKGVASARGTFTTLGEAPAWARVGIFAGPVSLPALVRFSNGAGAVHSDRVGDVRGMAVKVIGVPGKKLIPGLEDVRTQDFLAILTPTVPFPTPESFVGVVVAASGSKLLALPRVIRALGIGRFASVLKQLKAGLERPVASLAEVPFYTPLPIRWGDAAVKFMWAPLTSGAAGGATEGDERFAQDLAARLRGGPLRWELRIQAWVDEARTPIEDPTVLWDPAASPWVPVGRLELPQQDLEGAAAKELAARVERLSFDPWHAPAEFRPLGAMMRARAAAYRESVTERGVDAEPVGDEGWLVGPA